MLPFLLLLVAAVGPYVGSLRNGFAWDDSFIIGSNPVVQGGDLRESVRQPYWPDAFTFSGSGLYRPTTSAALTIQWAAFDGDPLGFHAVEVGLHAAVTLLVYALLAPGVSTAAALAGATVFAVHPVHVEAVANVVGQSELWASLFALLTLIAWRRWLQSGRAWERVGLSLIVPIGYLLALGAKEIAVTVPVLALLMSGSGGGARGIKRSVPLLALCGGVLSCYLALRLQIVGTLRGEVPAPELIGLSGFDRVFTGLSVWVDYVRLLVWPVQLSADYGPAVRFAAHGVDPLVVVGAVLLLGMLGAAFLLRESAPQIALGTGWVVLSLLPVSNLLFPAGVILAERTLYLPSIGLAFVLAGWTQGVRAPGLRRVMAGSFAVAVVLLALRTAARVPTWRDSGTVLASLAERHPDSHVVLRQQALQAMSEGRIADARAGFERALILVPRHFSLLTEAAQFEAVSGRHQAAQGLARRAVAVYPTSPHGYAVLARVLWIAGTPEDARAAAIEGLRRAEPLAPIWRELERVRQGRD